jgi:hypothetical protein
MLTYRTEDYYSTVTGGILSILLVSFVLAFMADEFILLVKKSHINTSIEFQH